MTKTEKQAALDAIRALLNIKDEGGGEGGGGNSQVPPEFAAAWNKIMEKYDDDNIPDSELIELRNKIASGSITNLD